MHRFKRVLTNAASLLLLFVCIILRLQGQLSLLFQFEYFLEQLIDIDVILGRGLEVFYFPHFLQYIYFFSHSQNKTDCLTSSASPVLVDTWRLPDSSSHLLPTSSTGQPSRLPFTSLISSSTGFNSSKLCREDIENTIMNAWPDRIQHILKC